MILVYRFGVSMDQEVVIELGGGCDTRASAIQKARKLNLREWEW